MLLPDAKLKRQLMLVTKKTLSHQILVLTGQNRHQLLIVVTNTFRLQHPSPISILRLMIEIKSPCPRIEKERSREGPVDYQQQACVAKAAIYNQSA